MGRLGSQLGGWGQRIFGAETALNAQPLDAGIKRGLAGDHRQVVLQRLGGQEQSIACAQPGAIGSHTDPTRRAGIELHNHQWQQELLQGALVADRVACPLGLGDQSGHGEGGNAEFAGLIVGQLGAEVGRAGLDQVETIAEIQQQAQRCVGRHDELGLCPVGEIGCEFRQAIEQGLPGRLHRQQHDRIADALDVDAIAGEAMFFGQADGLALAVGEEFGSLHGGSWNID